MEDISLHILDLAENSYRAQASKVDVIITTDIVPGMMVVEIIDNGIGMDEEMLKRCIDPFYTTQNKGFGLGIGLFAQSANEAEGEFSIKSEVGLGTSIEASFRLDNIDRKPLGDISASVSSLLMARPDVRLCLYLKTPTFSYEFDSDIWKDEITPIPINNIEVLSLIRQDISDGQKKFESET